MLKKVDYLGNTSGNIRVQLLKQVHQVPLGKGFLAATQCQPRVIEIS